jgi:Ca-activated chloride channel family protein
MKPGPSVRTDVELALVNITVTAPYDRIVTGLEADSFRVFEDNAEQEVVTFSSEDVPISVGVILDLSGSMANRIGEAKEAAMQFFKSANTDNEFLLVTVSEHAQLSSRWRR